MIHRIRLCYSTTGAASFNGWLETWLTNMEPWADPEVTNDVPTTTETIDGDVYHRGDLAFEWTEDRAIILDQLDQYLAAYCSWHRIGYHECGHDEENGGPCSWDEQRESGAVPGYVPSFDPE
jgi:hypothetical protein